MWTLALQRAAPLAYQQYLGTHLALALHLSEFADS